MLSCTKHKIFRVSRGGAPGVSPAAGCVAVLATQRSPWQRSRNYVETKCSVGRVWLAVNGAGIAKKMSTEEIEVKRRHKVNSRDNSATNSIVSSSSSSSSSGSSRSSIASTKSEEDAAVNSAQSTNLCINCSSHEANQVLTPISVQQARQR